MAPRFGQLLRKLTPSKRSVCSFCSPQSRAVFRFSFTSKDCGEQNEQTDRFEGVSLRSSWQKRGAMKFAVNEQDQRHADQSNHDAHTGSKSKRHAHHDTATSNG